MRLTFTRLVTPLRLAVIFDLSNGETRSSIAHLLAPMVIEGSHGQERKNTTSHIVPAVATLHGGLVQWRQGPVLLQLRRPA